MSLLFKSKPASSLKVSKPTDWLESRFHFSFADYFDKDRQNFGVLRVLNDDFVNRHSGFETHPHRDMEIFSYVLDGELTHKDSMGTAETLTRGAVQYMSAGTGVLHSEMNAGTERLRFLQTWIVPNRKGYAPNYGSRTFKREDRLNRVCHLLGGEGGDHHASTASDVIRLHQDCNIYVSEIESNETVRLPLGRGRQAYIVCAEGAATVNGGEKMNTRDALEVVNKGTEAQELSFVAGSAGAHLMIEEMAAV